ncbi:hypothetical protein SARC_01677 [Sphaeroforma arctica JP610]|uniref:TOG domain-containing protein n=1 Tax=Sphaeroforma arctica JP610 TaxID=667725 RepID=A0A0L0GB87_9EUKA|nr:hypothetical protein SARC_01677 [Sphaeroforma arctica JP610]KNC86151.1 hypothetical protein SARC_01677 [Sphaeroforma arctica JP610]|eukprot:XP_014160053.1 hypothetical protein SARC_01677 [Sphaeroforma arctica JP610]
MHTLLQKLAKLILDVNVHVCIEAAGCIAHIANGTKAQFGTQAIHVLPPILKRMKEKKATVLTALNEAAKAVLKTVSLDSIAPELLPFITDKNPSIRKETLVVTAFAITQTTLKILNKSLIKQLAELIIKVTSDSAAPVREAAYEALGAMQRVAGDRPMAPYLSDLDKLKQDKIKDYCDKCTGVKSSANASRPVAPREPIKATPAVASKKAIPTKDPPAMPAPAETKTAAAPKGRVAAPPW